MPDEVPPPVPPDDAPGLNGPPRGLRPRAGAVVERDDASVVDRFGEFVKGIPQTIEANHRVETTATINDNGALATLEKGQLMIRHPHFTQPIFVRFPRPSVMQGREGAERYPQASEVSLDAAVLRTLRELDPAITLAWVQDITALYTEDEIIRARNATVLARPDNVKAYFSAQFRKIIPVQAAPRPLAGSIKSAPENDPYGF